MFQTSIISDTCRDFMHQALPFSAFNIEKLEEPWDEATIAGTG